MDWKGKSFVGSSQAPGPLPESLARQLSRRKFIKTISKFMLGASFLGAGGIYTTRIEPGWFDLVQVQLKLPRLDSAFAGFRLVQISDIHISNVITAREVGEACQVAQGLKPDLVVLTGDFADLGEELHRLLDELSTVLRQLVQSVQTFAVLGNHDYRKGPTAVRMMLASLEVEELNNRVHSLSRGNARLHIAGVDDPWWGVPRLESVIGQLPEAGAAILLAHEPDFADVSAATGRFDLQLSGHTHGGQVVIPGLGPPVLPEFGRKYPSGLYRVGNMLQYTNRGIGMTEPYIRFNCRPEITLFTFQPGA